MSKFSKSPFICRFLYRYIFFFFFIQLTVFWCLVNGCIGGLCNLLASSRCICCFEVETIIVRQFIPCFTSAEHKDDIELWTAGDAPLFFPNQMSTLLLLILHDKWIKNVHAVLSNVGCNVWKLIFNTRFLWVNYRYWKIIMREIVTRSPFSPVWVLSFISSSNRRENRPLQNLSEVYLVYNLKRNHRK